MPGLPNTSPPPTPSSYNTLTGGSLAVGDPLSNLLELQWRGIPFPSIMFSENGSQQLSVHRFPNQDSARVEPTGRMPSRFTCRAVLTNSVFPGQNESWKQGQLFPLVYDKLLASFYTDSSQSPGTLQHPSLGPITCRVVKWDYSFAGAGPRDGVFLDIEWIETIGNQPLVVTNASNQTSYALPSSLSNPPLSPPNLSLGQFMQLLNSTIKQVVSFPANTLDGIQSQISVINGAAQGIAASLITAIPQTLAAGVDFTQANKNMFVNGAAVTAYDGLAPGSVYAQQIATIASAGIYQPPTQQSQTIAGNSVSSDPGALPAVYKAAFALNNTASGNGLQFLQKTQSFLENLIYYYQSLGNISVADTVVQLNLLLNLVQQAQSTLFSNNKNYQVNTYVTKVNISWSALAKILNQNVDDLIDLNPITGQLYFIPANTSVSFYQS